MQRRRISRGHRKAAARLTRLALAGGMLGLIAASAAQADIYAWRTEDGGYAYTDNRDQVPARYADQAHVRSDTDLREYERYTATDTAASERYAARLEARLRHLRTITGSQANAAAPVRRSDVRSIAIATGNPQAPTVNIEPEGNAAPIVIEPVRTLGRGNAITRSSTLVKQGGRTIAVLKGQSHEISLDDDVYDTRTLIPDN
jgi:Domain of unknown function (DUF4124)